MLIVWLRDWWCVVFEPMEVLSVEQHRVAVPWDAERGRCILQSATWWYGSEGACAARPRQDFTRTRGERDRWLVASKVKAPN